MHALLPPVGDGPQFVRVVPLLDQFEGIPLVEQHVNGKAYIGRTQARGVEGQQSHLEGVEHGIGARDRPFEDRLAATFRRLPRAHGAPAGVQIHDAEEAIANRGIAGRRLLEMQQDFVPVSAARSS